MVHSHCPYLYPHLVRNLYLAHLPVVLMVVDHLVVGDSGSFGLEVSLDLGIWNIHGLKGG